MKIQFELDSADDASTVVVQRETAPAMGDTIVTGNQRYIVTRIVHMLDLESDDPAMIVAATSR